MSEQTKKVENSAPEEPSEVSEQDLDNVAGGKSYFESHSNNASIAGPTPSKQPPPPGTPAS